MIKLDYRVIKMNLTPTGTSCTQGKTDKPYISISIVAIQATVYHYSLLFGAIIIVEIEQTAWHFTKVHSQTYQLGLKTIIKNNNTV